MSGGHELFRLIVTGSIPPDLPAGALGDIPPEVHANIAQQVEKALRSYWAAVDWKVAPVEPVS